MSEAKRKNMESKFLQIVDRLAVWKFFPSGRRDRKILAAKLAEWCGGELEKAQWLLCLVDEFDEYPGPSTIRRLIKAKFQLDGRRAEQVEISQVVIH